MPVHARRAASASGEGDARLMSGGSGAVGVDENGHFPSHFAIFPDGPPGAGFARAVCREEWMPQTSRNSGFEVRMPLRAMGDSL
jgi:hypothetical protein